MKRAIVAVPTVLMLVSAIGANEFHVAVNGKDSDVGTRAAPLRTIQRAAGLAQPGDVITVHEGVYRERISPPRGGQSEARRITYQAAPGEKVEIKGSQVVKNWVKVGNGTWKVSIPNSFFGGFNPYADLIRGDWFSPKGRDHHTGAVYVNGHWLTEAARLEDVLKPVADAPLWSRGQFLMNVAWLRCGEGRRRAGRVRASGFAAQHGIQTAPCSEGETCIGWIEHGDWARYEGVDLGLCTERLEIRAASATCGGIIEVRLDAPDGELLGSCKIPNTGGWQSWSSFVAKIRPTDGANTLCLVFKVARSLPADSQLWFAQVDDKATTIWAQFADGDPNDAEVEINVRQTIFYPENPGINYITVRGFAMMHAATPWAPPTAEQIGLIGTHWSKGWAIENNDIHYSMCAGISLGKYGDQWDNTSQDTAEGYVKTIERALGNGWSKENIGRHIVRDNHISHCEQAGIVGSLGAAFCTVTRNDIHDIHVRQLFTGAEMAGIKFHAAIDTEISRNHIYRTCRGIWLDWMTQGTRVTGNLLHDNGPWEDLYVEKNHGPFLVDNNLFLSPIALLDVSQGGAFVHNLFAGRIAQRPELRRETPFHRAHSTEVAGIRNISGGDSRFYNNLFAASNGLAEYDAASLPLWMDGNVFFKGARPSKHEMNPLVAPELDPAPRLVEKADGLHLEIALGEVTAIARSRRLVTTELLGKAAIPNLPYEQPDGSPIRVNTDYFGKPRSESNPMPGPFRSVGEGVLRLKLW